MKVSQAGIDLIKQFEGLELGAYVCPAGILTIGYGHTGDDVKPGMKIDEAEAEALLRADLERFEECVESHVTQPITQSQFDAMCCFAYNVGCKAFHGSTLLTLVNAGNHAAAQQQFLRWNKGGGKVLAGLTRRRAAEADLFGTA